MPKRVAALRGPPIEGGLVSLDRSFARVLAAKTTLCFAAAGRRADRTHVDVPSVVQKAP